MTNCSSIPAHRRRSIALLMSVTILFVSSCSEDVVKDSAPAARSVDIDSIPDAVPKAEPKSRYGNPESYEVFGERYYVLNSSKDFVQRGIASWYGKKFHGRRTSSGETYDMYAMTAAHKNLPLPTYVEVKNLNNNKRVVVKVNDRGPFHDNRIIDLSYTAARKLDIVAKGTGLVEVRAIHKKSNTRNKELIKKEGAPVRTAMNVAPTSGFYIQVGAFSEALNAIRLQTRLAGIGDELIKVNEAKVNGQVVYRVQIGPIHKIDEADSIVEQLGDYGVTEHRIVVH
jgi:rare lipoprotein A